MGYYGSGNGIPGSGQGNTPNRGISPQVPSKGLGDGSGNLAANTPGTGTGIGNVNAPMRPGQGAYESTFKAPPVAPVKPQLQQPIKTGIGTGTNAPGSGIGNSPMPEGNTVLGEAKKGWNAIDLWNSTLKLSPNRAQSKPIGTRTLKNLVPYVGSKSVLFQVLTTGQTVSWMVYQTDLFFSDIVFTNNPAETNPREWIEIKQGNLAVWMKKIDLRKNRVRVRCSCVDFYMVWGYADFEKGAIFGSKPKKYVRKTIYNPTAPVGQRGVPPRNPSLLVGFCKHTKAAIDLAQQNGWILPTPRLG